MPSCYWECSNGALNFKVYYCGVPLFSVRLPGSYPWGWLSRLLFSPSPSPRKAISSTFTIYSTVVTVRTTGFIINSIFHFAHSLCLCVFHESQNEKELPPPQIIMTTQCFWCCLRDLTLILRRSRKGTVCSTLLPATREQHDQNCTQSH